MSTAIDTKIKRAILLEPLAAGSDLSSLSGYQITTMFGTRTADELPSVFDTQLYMRAVLQWCHDNKYDGERDVFVVSGRLTKVAIALAALCLEYPYSGLSVLIYDGASCEYKERQL